MTKNFTGGGDEGYTGILGADRLPKHHIRLETVGSLDEATSTLGLARANARTPAVKELLAALQRDLYQIMAETAATPENAVRFRSIFPERVAWLEEQTHTFSQNVQTPDGFILPGDTQAGAFLDLARTVIRRAERRLSELVHQGEVENPALLPYMNRLSSLIFVLELYENQAAGTSSPTLAKPG